MEAIADRSGLHFIVSTDRRKLDTGTRKLIRSHVMKGKNKGKTRHRDCADPKPPTTDRTQHEQDDRGLSIIVNQGHNDVPRNIGSDLAFFPLADDIDYSLVVPIFKFSSKAKSMLFPLEPCVIFDDRSRRSWREPMCSDAVYLNAMVFVYHTYINLAAGLELESLPPSSPANKYFPKTLRLLRERLADSSDNMKLSDSTVIVVLSLANHAHRLGQYEAARSHLGGLRKLVDLRGGISNFRRNPKLLLEMFRCDIGMALHNGLDTLFFNDPTREQYMPYLDKLSSFIPLECRPDVETCTRSNTLGLTCPELAKAWDMMQTFCSLINYAAESKRKIPQETMLNTMAAVMYRLLHMRFPSGSLDEVVRLGLSVFCSHIFLQWSNVGLPLHNLPLAYKTCLLDFGNSSKISTKILFWLLMVGRMAVFGADEDTWLKPWLWLSVNECGAGSWGEARTIVQHFQWIDFVHDQYGRVIYDAVCALHFSDGNTPHIVGIHSVKTTSPA